jgi:hypothetical protein
LVLIVWLDKVRFLKQKVIKMSVSELLEEKKEVKNVSVEWRNDPDALSIVKFVGLEPTLETIPLSKIDWNGSANNCARLTNPLNEEKIEEYASRMKAGDVFPCVVVELGRQGYVILGGNQRINAAKRINAEGALAYVVSDINSSQRESLIRSLNARHGWGMSKDDRLEHAVFLVRDKGIAVADASHLMVVSDHTIRRRIRADEARASMARKGIDTSALSLTHLDFLTKVVDEDYQEQIARIACENAVTAESLKGAVESVCSARNRAGMVAAIREWSKDLVGPADGVKKKNLGSPRKRKFMDHLSKLNDFLERGNNGTGFSSVDELQCASADLDKIKVLATKILIRLKVIAGV